VPELTFSAAPRHKRAAWQERLTFGPGDVMDIHTYGDPAMSRTNVFVAPDGRISYLQAQDIVASGLTVEELRQRLNDELAPYYKKPVQTIVIPVRYNSKKYYMLGKVASRGVYSLDRPLTIVEAVARARGLETGLYQRTTVEMADLAHSFIERGGQKLPVDLEKLFLDGDLSQNVALEPDDYIYFASSAANEIYILGEVYDPGPIGFVANASLIAALTDRGGFTDKAYKKKVLVIRGSLNQPETFVVDTGGILEARLPDFKLEPKDIVYVSRRPWSKIEELADEAMQAFIEGSVTAWTGVNIGPVFNHKIIPDLHSR
jgi:protein involved in polysaccharide export with SLBB domain